MRVLVVGGAGYIGAHMCKMLAESDHEIVVLDNFSTGHKAAVQWGRLEEMALADVDRLDAVFEKYQFDSVMHFAAASIVGESVRDPLKYYENNVSDVISLLRAMQRHRVMRFVFSSTAAVFGEPQSDFIDEQHPRAPINPYGASKLTVERILMDCASAYGLSSVALRYFNAAGADPSSLIGESHLPETHLIPKLLRRVAGEDIDVRIFGTDYPTPDGTCIRDYVHVNDLCSAHLLALNRLREMGSPAFEAFNLGNGRGYSVKEIITAVARTTGKTLDLPLDPPRHGDPARLVADGSLAKAALGWTPKYTEIADIIDTAWKWHRQPRY
ncbi:MAG: galE [Nevskia sp.]|nr:galE [Nevskia sp.]